MATEMTYAILWNHYSARVSIESRGFKPLSQALITGNELHTALAAAGSRVTPDKIERWRREGLLPSPNQIGHGRGNGSHTEVPLASVAQALEIAGLYAMRRKRNWVGWQLWLRGFDVAERYWREPLEKARSTIEWGREAGTNYNERQSKKTGLIASAIKSAALTIARRTPLFAPVAKLPPDMVETLIGYGIEILRGEFTGFSPAADDNPDRDLDAVIEAIGAVMAEHHLIGGHSIDFKGQIEPALREIGKGFSRIIRQRRIAEPSPEARQEFLMGLEIGTSLYHNSKPQFGRNALGLGIFNRIATNPAITIQALMLLVWSEYRTISDMKLSFSQIAEMHELTTQLVSKNPELTMKM